MKRWLTTHRDAEICELIRSGRNTPANETTARLLERCSGPTTDDAWADWVRFVTSLGDSTDRSQYTHFEWERDSAGMWKPTGEEAP